MGPCVKLLFEVDAPAPAALTIPEEDRGEPWARVDLRNVLVPCRQTLPSRNGLFGEKPTRE